MSNPYRPSKRRTASQVTPAQRIRGYCAACDKHTYLDKDHARDEKRRLRRDNALDGDTRPLTIYRCPDNPEQWHIGHDHLRIEETRRYYLGHGVS